MRRNCKRISTGINRFEKITQYQYVTNYFFKNKFFLDTKEVGIRTKIHRFFLITTNVTS